MNNRKHLAIRTLMTQFADNKCIFFPQNKTNIMNTRHFMFLAKWENNVYHCKPQFYLYKSGV